MNSTIRTSPFGFCCAVAAFLIGASSAAADPVIVGDLGKNLDSFLTYTTKFPDGISGTVMVAKNGKVVLSKGYGFADKDKKVPIDERCQWDIASITKQFTAAAILKLEMEGKLNIDASIKKIFPRVVGEMEKVTLRHLLSHTSGINNDPPFDKELKTSRDALGYFLSQPMISSPGEKFAYSNVGYCILAIVVEQKSGMSWERYLEEKIFKPAGLKETFCLGNARMDEKKMAAGTRGQTAVFPYGRQNHWYGYRGAGGVITTAQDMFMWDQALRSEKVLSVAAKKKLFTLVKDKYGLGWQFEKDALGKPYVFHGGAVPGFISHFRRSLTEDVSVFVATNTFEPQLANEIANSLWTMVLSGTSVDYSNSGTPTEADAQKYEGEYTLNEGGAIILKAIGKDIELSTSNAKAAETILRGDGKMVNGWGTVNEILKGVMDGLSVSQESKAFDEAINPKTVGEGKVTQVKALLMGDSTTGKYVSHKVCFYYFAELGIIHQFVMVKYMSSERLLRIVWHSGKLTTVEDWEGKPMASMKVTPVRTGTYAKPNQGSWMGATLMLQQDADSKRTIVLSGGGLQLRGVAK